MQDLNIMIKNTHILWADGEKGGCKCGKQSFHLDISLLKEKRATDELTITGTNMESVLGTSGMLIFFQAIANLQLENKLGLPISVNFQNVICSSHPPVSSKSSRITHLAVGLGEFH